MLTIAYSAGAEWNDTYWNHERFNALLVEARAELDQTKRHEMYVECQRILRDEGGAIVFMFRDHVEAANTKVGFSNIAGNWAADGNRNAERWWFKS